MWMSLSQLLTISSGRRAKNKVPVWKCPLVQFLMGNPKIGLRKLKTQNSIFYRFFNIKRSISMTESLISTIYSALKRQKWMKYFYEKNLENFSRGNFQQEMTISLIFHYFHWKTYELLAMRNRFYAKNCARAIFSRKSELQYVSLQGVEKSESNIFQFFDKMDFTD